MFPVWYRVVFCRDHESEMKWKSSFCQKSGLFYEVFLFDVPFISTLCWVQLFERLNLVCSYLFVNKWNFYFFVGSIAVNAGSWMIKMSSLNDNWIPRLFAWFQNEIGMGLDHEKLMRLKSRLSGVGTPHSFRNFMTKNTFRNSEPGNEAQIRNWRYGLSLASKYDDGQDFLIFAPISVNHCDDLARLVRPSTPGRAIGTFMYLIGWYHFYTS